MSLEQALKDLHEQVARNNELLEKQIANFEEVKAKAGKVPAPKKSNTTKKHQAESPSEDEEEEEEKPAPKKRSRKKPAAKEEAAPKKKASAKSKKAEAKKPITQKGLRKLVGDFMDVEDDDEYEEREDFVVAILEEVGARTVNKIEDQDDMEKVAHWVKLKADGNDVHFDNDIPEGLYDDEDDEEDDEDDE